MASRQAAIAPTRPPTRPRATGQLSNVMHYGTRARFDCQRNCMILLKTGKHRLNSKIPFCSVEIDEILVSETGQGGIIKTLEPPNNTLLPLSELLAADRLLGPPRNQMVLLPPQIVLLEQSLVAAVELLNRCCISFPVTDLRQLYLHTEDFTRVDKWSLYFRYNPRARRITDQDRMSLTWKEDQVARAKMLLTIPKIISYVHHKSIALPGDKVFVDKKSQDELCQYFYKNGVDYQAVVFCAFKIGPYTAELALNFAYGFVIWEMNGFAYNMLRELFGDFALARPLSVSHGITNAHAMYIFYKQALRQRVEQYRQENIDANQAQAEAQTNADNDHNNEGDDSSLGDEGDETTLVNDSDLEVYHLDMPVGTPSTNNSHEEELERIKSMKEKTLARIIICRAEIAEQFQHPNRQQWWEQAYELYKAFLINDPDECPLDYALLDMFVNGVYTPRDQQNPRRTYRY